MYCSVCFFYIKFRKKALHYYFLFLLSLLLISIKILYFRQFQPDSILLKQPVLINFMDAILIFSFVRGGPLFIYCLLSSKPKKIFSTVSMGYSILCTVISLINNFIFHEVQINTFVNWLGLWIPGTIMLIICVLNFRKIQVSIVKNSILSLFVLSFLNLLYVVISQIISIHSDINLPIYLILINIVNINLEIVYFFKPSIMP